MPTISTNLSGPATAVCSQPVLPPLAPILAWCPVLTALLALNCGSAAAHAAAAVASLKPEATVTPALPSRVCAFDPDRGLPNPLGMRAYVTITEAEGNTTFLFEQFPTLVTYHQVKVAATLALTRQLVFYNVSLEQARQLMLHEPNYYTELVGYADGEGFAPLNAVLTCRSSH